MRRDGGGTLADRARFRGAAGTKLPPRTVPRGAAVLESARRPSTVAVVTKTARTAWPNVRGAPRLIFPIALLIAVVLHAPALPFDPIFLARILLHTSAPPAETEPESHEVLIPIDLDLEAAPPRTEDVKTPPPDQPENPGSAEPAPSAAAEPPAAPSAGKQDAPATPGPAITTRRADAIYDDLDQPRHATSTLKEPLAIAGGPGQIGPKDAFVQILFNSNRLRGNPAGSAMGSLLTSLPDWKTFFEGTSIDPITDTDHLLIAGPQLRDSRDVVVWMQHRVPESDMHDAIDGLVKRTKGAWLEGTPIPAAVAEAHNHKRIFALVPGKKLLVIFPEGAKDQLARAKRVRPFSNASRAGIVIALATPRNAFVGYEDVVDVPASFKWLRMVATPVANGGADVVLEIGDASPEDARKHGPLIEDQLAKVRTLAKIATIIGAEVLPPMPVEVDRDILRVHAIISPKGLNHILNLARTHFAKKAQEDAKKKEESARKAAADAKKKDDGAHPPDANGKKAEASSSKPDAAR
jgi:hypothetical protein